MPLLQLLVFDQTTGYHNHTIPGWPITLTLTVNLQFVFSLNICWSSFYAARCWTTTHLLFHHSPLDGHAPCSPFPNDAETTSSIYLPSCEQYPCFSGGDKHEVWTCWVVVGVSTEKFSERLATCLPKQTSYIYFFLLRLHLWHM